MFKPNKMIKTIQILICLFFFFYLFQMINKHCPKGELCTKKKRNNGIVNKFGSAKYRINNKEKIT